jgi:hypothetical protein
MATCNDLSGVSVGSRDEEGETLSFDMVDLLVIGRGDLRLDMARCNDLRGVVRSREEEGETPPLEVVDMVDLLVIAGRGLLSIVSAAAASTSIIVSGSSSSVKPC